MHNTPDRPSKDSELARLKRLLELERFNRTFHWEVNQEGLFTYVSPTIQDVMGYTAEEVVNRAHFYDWFPEEARDALRQEAFEIFERKESFRGFENQNRTKEGKLVWLSTNALPVFDDDGELKGYCGTDTDVTEAKQMEEHLKENRNVLAQILDLTPTAVTVVDSGGKIVMANRVATNIIGLHPTGLMGKHFDDPDWQIEAVDGGEFPEEDLPFNRIKESGTSVNEIRHAIRWPDGSRKILSINGAPLEMTDGKVTKSIFTINDITEPENTKNQLKLFEDVLLQAKDAVLITDDQLEVPGGPHIIYANPAMEQMCGYSRSELLGNSPGMLQGEKTDRAMLRKLKQELQKGNTFRAETVNYRKDGSEYLVEWTIVPLLDEEGKIRHWASHQRDVTDIRRREQEDLNQNRLDTLGNLVGGVVHDMNNILAPILMGSELLLHSLPEEADKETAESIFRSSKRAGDILKKLLLFSRGSSGDRSLIHPEHVLMEVYDITQETFPKDISVEPYVPENPWPVRAGEHELQQVLLNLALNARDCLENREDGMIRLELENQESKEPRVLIRVVDNGPGMDLEMQERIFEPFFTTKEQGKGTGLGLSSVRGVIQSLDGEVSVDSELGRGCTFTISLPAFPEEAVQESETSSSLHRGNGERIVIVDDEVPMVELLVGVLKQYGYAPKGFTSSVEAIKEFRGCDRSEAPDLVLTDVIMPKQDGLQVAIAAQECFPGVPVVAMSGFVGHEKQEELRDRGVTTLLQKPIRMETLLNTLQGELQGS
jgi:PAS domain S-box-containing protein